MSRLSEKYIKEWRDLAAPIEKLTGAKHYAFDPDLAFAFGPRTISIDRWFAELINTGVGKLESDLAMLRKAIGDIAEMCENPKNRGAMTQRQQAALLDQMHGDLRGLLKEETDEAL